MQLVELPAAPEAVRRYVETLWLPYHRELEATVDAHALATNVDLVEKECAFRLEMLESTSHPRGGCR